MKKHIYSLLVFTFLCSFSYAQKLTGIVLDDNGVALEKATVSLLKPTDSSVIKFSVTADDGTFTIEANPGNYIIQATYVGYITAYSSPIQVADKDIEVPAILLSKVSADLQDVVIRSQRPIIEVKADKTILNVEGTINAVGNDGLELLRKAPGVMIDKDDNISLAGKNGVQIFIDGKPSPLAGADLANYLRSLQSDQVESIEIITNPSARYEAAGNAGIINIRLKKNKAFGTNGSVNAGYGIGTYGKYNGGLSLNHRNKGINVFGNYSFNKSKNANQMIAESTQFDTLFKQSTKGLFRMNYAHNFKAGMDYYINNKSTIGAVVTGNISDMENSGNTPMEFFHIPTGNRVKVLESSNAMEMNRKNMNFNVNYRYTLPNDKDFSIDADYGLFRNGSNQFQPNHYFQGNGTTPINSNVYRMVAPTDIDIYSFKTDYEQNYKGGRLGIGAKVSYVNTDNDFKRYNVFGNSQILDTARSNRFDYKENINALYVNYNKQVKAIMIQFGLRMENTNIKGTSTGFEKVGTDFVPFDSTINRNYTGLFPSAAVTFNKNPMNQWTVSYSRRIDRPAYQDLNPFMFLLNEYMYMQGNTQLRPQYTNSVSVTNVYQYRLTTSLNYSYVNDIFAQLPDTIETSKGFMKKENLATQNIVSLNISYPFQKDWYSFFANLNTNYSIYKANFGGGDRNINLKVFTLQYYMQNSFRLGKGWTGELSGWYLTPSVWQGTIKSKAMGGVDAGIQKQLFDKKATLRLVLSDVFQTIKWGGSTNFTGMHSTMRGWGEMPVFRINFSYRFGSNTVKAAAQRKTGLEDEKQRAEGGGNQQGGAPTGGN